MANLVNASGFDYCESPKKIAAKHSPFPQPENMSPMAALEFGI